MEVMHSSLLISDRFVLGHGHWQSLSVFKISISRTWKSSCFVSSRDFVQINIWHLQVPRKNVK